jgi:hypothetical protein
MLLVRLGIVVVASGRINPATGRCGCGMTSSPGDEGNQACLQ